MLSHSLSYHLVTSTVTSDAITEDVQFLPALLFDSNVTGGQVVGVQAVDENVVLASGAFRSQSTVIEAVSR